MSTSRIQSIFCLNGWSSFSLLSKYSISSIRIDHQIKNVCSVSRVRDGIYQFFDEQIEEHRQEIDFETSDSKDYVETFMKEQKKREAEGDFASFSNEQLKNMCFDMWVAGMHTTTNTMGFLTAFALNNMDAQRKMQKELTEVIGDRVVTMKDKLNLPYTNAFINVSSCRLKMII